MNNTLFWTIETMCLISLIISCFLLGFLLRPDIVDWINHPTSYVNYTSNCTNLSLEATADCLREDLSRWFVYNHSNLEKSYDEETLKKEGGVCWHAAKYYESKAEGLGYYGTTCIIKINETMTHEIALVSGGNGNYSYCILDQQLYPQCI